MDPTIGNGPFLEIVEGNDAGKKYPLGANPVVVGRGANCTFILADLSVSRKHFDIIPAKDGYMLRDMGSGNGTKVNGAKVKEHFLADGDLIVSGKTKMKYCDPRARMAPAAPMPGQMPPGPMQGQMPPGGMPPGARPGPGPGPGGPPPGGRKPTMYQAWGAGGPPGAPGGPGMPPGGMPPGMGGPGMPPGGMPPGGMPPGGMPPGARPGPGPGPGGRPMSVPPGQMPSPMPPGMQPGMMGGPGMPPGMQPGMMGGPGMPPGMQPGMMGGPGMPPGMRPPMGPPGRIPGMPDDRTANVNALPYQDPMQMSIQAQNQQTGSALSRLLNTRGKKIIAVVVVVMVVLFGMLTALKFSGKKDQGPKIDPAEQARLDKEEAIAKLLSEAASFYNNDESLDKDGRVSWDKMLEKLDEADKVAPGTDAVLKSRKIAETGKAIDDALRFVQARLPRPGFPTSESAEKLKDAPKLLDEIKENLSEKARAYFEGQLAIASGIIEKRTSDAKVVNDKLTEIAGGLAGETTKAGKASYLKKYDELLTTYPDCKKAVDLRNALVAEALSAAQAKKETREFSGKPSLIDPCRVESDVTADKAAFDEKAVPALLVAEAGAGPSAPSDPGAVGVGGGGSALPAAVKAKYDSKDFSGAATLAKELAAKESGAKAQKLTSQAAALEAMAAAFLAIDPNSTNYEAQFTAYDKCVTSDSQLGGTHLAECKTGLGKNAKLLAGARLAQGNLEGAFQAYQKAVAVGEDVANVLKGLESKAQTIYEDAYKLGDAPGARDKYNQVLRIVPSTSEVYQKAQARLSGAAMPTMSTDIVIMTTPMEPVMTPAMTPVMEPAMTPVMEPVMTPAMTPVMEPVMTPVMTPTMTMRVVLDDDDDD